MKKMTVEQNFNYIKANIRKYYNDGMLKEEETYSFDNWIEFHSKSAQTKLNKLVEAYAKHFETMKQFRTAERNTEDEKVIEILRNTVTNMHIW